MRWSIWLGLSLGGLVATGLGCASLRGPHQEYLTPRVVGRVLDARTGAPVPNARVRHLPGSGAAVPEAMPEARGASRLIETAGVRTDRHGWFDLPAHKGFFLLFHHGSGSFGTIIVEHAAYQTLRTNLSANPAASVRTDRGPAADAGNLMLEPKTGRTRQP